MRHTSSHTKNRRSHHALAATNLVTDKESGALRLPHRLDETTGMYRGKQIVPSKVMKQEVKHAKKVAQHKKEHIHAEGVKEPIHSDKEDKKMGVVGRVAQNKAKAPVGQEKDEKKGLLGRMTLGKAKSRSGFGGGA